MNLHTGDRVRCTTPPIFPQSSPTARACFLVRPRTAGIVVTGGRDGNIMFFDTRAPADAQTGLVPPVARLAGAHDGGAAPAPKASKLPSSKGSAADMKRGVTSMAWSLEGRYLVTGGACDGSVKVWDVRRLPPAPGAPQPAARRGVRKGASSAGGGGSLSAGGADGAVLTLSQPVESGRQYGVSSVDVSPDGASLLAAYTSNRILTYDLPRLLHGAGGAPVLDDGAIRWLVSGPPSADAEAAAGTSPSSQPSPLPAAALPGRSELGGPATGSGKKRPRSAASLSGALSPTRAAQQRHRLTEFRTPARASVRYSQAWQTLGTRTPGGEALVSEESQSANAGHWDEFGGHSSGGFYSKARFSRCGRFVLSGSHDGNAYVWATEPAMRSSREDGDESDLIGCFPALRDRRFTGAYRSRHILPLVVLPHHAAQAVNDIAWGGIPVDAAPLDGCLTDSLRIATGCDLSIVRVWAPFNLNGAPADGFETASDAERWLSTLGKPQPTDKPLTWPLSHEQLRGSGVGSATRSAVSRAYSGGDGVDFRESSSLASRRSTDADDDPRMVTLRGLVPEIFLYAKSWSGGKDDGNAGGGDTDNEDAADGPDGAAARRSREPIQQLRSRLQIQRAVAADASPPASSPLAFTAQSKHLRDASLDNTVPAASHSKLADDCRPPAVDDDDNSDLSLPAQRFSSGAALRALTFSSALPMPIAGTLAQLSPRGCSSMPPSQPDLDEADGALEAAQCALMFDGSGLSLAASEDSTLFYARQGTSLPAPAPHGSVPLCDLLEGLPQSRISLDSSSSAAIFRAADGISSSLLLSPQAPRNSSGSPAYAASGGVTRSYSAANASPEASASPVRSLQLRLKPKAVTKSAGSQAPGSASLITSWLKGAGTSTVRG